MIVWGAICYNSKSPSVSSYLNATSYTENVLELIAVSCLQRRAKPISQKKNARPHMAQVNLQYLEKANMIAFLWTVGSPVLSPGEYVRGIDSIKLGNLLQPPDKLNDLQLCIQQA